MKFSNTFLAALSILGLSVHAKVSYSGTKVIRLSPADESQVKFLDNLIDEFGLSTWKNSHRPLANVDIPIPKPQIKAFEKAITDRGFKVDVMHEDLEVSIATEAKDSLIAFAGNVDITWFNAYHPYADHLAWLTALASTYPSNSQVITSGTSSGGKTITGIHIYGTGGPGSKPAVILHGTVHAREWISAMVNEYLAYSLLTNYGNSTEVKGYVDKYDFYIFPVVNPDGFVYTQTTDRLWRKNRQTNSGSTCVGRDVNRNWPWKWEVPGGASTNPCSETYKGAAAGDATETQGLSNFINNLSHSTAGAKMYIDWHSYSQLFMSPYGYSCSVLPPDNSELTSLAAGFGNALKAVYGTSFRTGPICTTIYQATGSSADYTYDVSKIKYSFAAELRDTGNNGFVLPTNQIKPSGEEVWAGFKYLLANIH